MQIKVKPMFQGLQPNLLSSADADQGLAVPDGFQGQQSSPGTLFFMPVVQLLPWFSILGRQTLEEDSAIHDTLPQGRHVDHNNNLNWSEKGVDVSMSYKYNGYLHIDS
jgi:hypothetical protein